MASSSEQISPAADGGHGRDMREANLWEDPSFGGLKGRTFSSCCPPDVQPNTRIIAVCGISDYVVATNDTSSEEEQTKRPKPLAQNIFAKGKDFFSRSRRQQRKDAKNATKSEKVQPGNASPRDGGWFFSDFFLFHHLFRGLGSNQIWMTCESPRKLVQKYGEYLHGEPNDRRVVLAADQIPQLEADGNVRVFKRGELLEDFIRTFSGECGIAVQQMQPVLLLIFGHGQESTHGVAIGGIGHGPYLHINLLEQILRGSNISTALLMTSCYSGGWLYRPELNVTAATPAGPRTESLSWSMSIGGRYHGSFWATAVMKAFVTFEDERLTQHHPQPTGAIDLEIVRQSSPFAKLAAVIHDTLSNEVDLYGSEHQIRFAAQDDAWSHEWRQRSGIPLGSFRQKWLALRQVAPQQQHSTEASESRTGRVRSIEPTSSASEGSPGIYGCKKGITRRQARSVVIQLCYKYLDSFPGLSNRASNTSPHSRARRLINGERLPHGQIEGLQVILTYRMNLMKLATEYKLLLKLDFPACESVDVDEYIKGVIDEGRAEGNPQDNKKHKFFHVCNSEVMAAHLFPPQPITTGLPALCWQKQNLYLAAALTESGRSIEDIRAGIAMLADYKENRVQSLRALIADDGKVRDTARLAFSTLGKRLRSSSPRKRGPIPSFGGIAVR
ncbi:MAG: hypothetical protein Q9196_003893 [Gyalolechia fulgens]